MKKKVLHLLLIFISGCVSLKETYNVSFDSMGGSSIASIKVIDGSRISEPAQPVKAGYSFAGWYKSADYKSAWNFGSDTVKSDVVLYAKWLTSSNTRTVTFNNMNGTSATIMVFEYDSKITPPSDPVWEDHTFTGWYTSESCSTLWDFNNNVVFSNMTLYAGWTITQYKVTFDTGEGSTVLPVLVNPGSKVTEPAPPTWIGGTFEGWYTGQDYTTRWDFNSNTVESSITLYAHWNFNVYTVSFDTNGGSYIGSILVSHGSTITAPSQPLKSSYTFVRWYRESTCLNAWNFASDVITGPTTLYAGWSDKFYLYVANTESNDISMFSILDDGTLSLIGYYSLGPKPEDASYPSTGSLGPTHLVMHPRENILYVSYRTYNSSTGEFSGRVGIFKVEDNGYLTSIGGINSGSSFCGGINIHPSKPLLYLSVQSAVVNVYQINADYTLSGPVPNNFSQCYPNQILLNPSGSYMYTTSGGTFGQGTIRRFWTGSGTDPNPVSAAVVPTGQNKGVAIHPSGNYLYATAYCPSDPNSDDYRVYVYDADLNMIGSVLTYDSNNVSAAVHPNGNYLYVGTGAIDHIIKFDIGTDGNLVQSSRVEYSCDVAHAFAFHPNAKYLYCVTWDTNGKIATFRINDNGTLSGTPQSGYPDSGLQVLDCGRFPTELTSCSIIKHSY